MLIQSQNTGGGDMHCRLTDLRKKEVINVKDGARSVSYTHLTLPTKLEV